MKAEEVAANLLEAFKFTGLMKRKCALIAVELILSFCDDQYNDLFEEVKSILEK